MPSRHLSFRVDSEVFDLLDAESKRTRQSRSSLAKTLLEEGLLMESHPGIIFRSGPAGRRAGLIGGPDVWEVVSAYDASMSNAVDFIAKSMSLSSQQVRTALRYYADQTAEIDDWINRVDDEAEQAFEAWRREERLLGR